MQFSQKTILELFDSSQKTFVVPVYQRAYSWETKEWGVFMNDIIEQIKGDNNYFYGNILLETINPGIEYEVIDGQQRLTTLTIFMRAIFFVINERIQKGEKITIKVKAKEKIYFKNSGNIKLRPVDYDRACYDTLIIAGKDSYVTNTPSQNRIKEAKSYFIKELQNEKTISIIKILDKIEKTKLTCIELQGKKDSALMFELQNNRGKDLTNMEKLKSFFMYQMYVYSIPNETESNITYISDIFKLIYQTINDLKKLNEDSVLVYHCNSFLGGGYNYSIGDIKRIFKDGKDKVEWIKSFVQELHTTFSNIKKFEKSNDSYALQLEKLGIPAYIYPFIIKGYKYFGDNKDKLSSLFHLLEIVVFRDNLINSRADIYSRLNNVLMNFTEDLNELRESFKNRFNDSWYWGDSNVQNYLNGWIGTRILRYLFWRYEDSIQSRGYKIGSCEIENEQIEHISPQTPTNGEPLTMGYEVDENNEYDEEFKSKYLNCLGNVMLISGSHNASIGNKPFVEKLNSYMSNPLLKQQAEIKQFISGNIKHPKWDKTAIVNRHKIIFDFAVKTWGFDNIHM
ncbi:MAG: hypothetical protein JWO44_2037 [Bacteroidetes bacterium]|nr:hypothetical protein [Bacteroidota bacterium]